MNYYRHVVRFGEHMYTQLVLNDHKDGWTEMTAEECCGHLLAEVQELIRAVNLGRPLADIQREAGDVGNFAMMITELYR